MTEKPKPTTAKKVGKIVLYLFIAFILLGIVAVATDSGEEKKEVATINSTEKSPESNSTSIPSYTIVKQDIDAKDAIYRVQVGDTLPGEKECIAMAQKITGLENTTTKNTAVFITRAGYDAEHGAHASVTFLKDKEAPEYRLIGATNAQMRAGTLNVFDSISDKKLILECLDESGTKVFIYKKKSGEYFKAIVFSKGSYDLEPLKADPANNSDHLIFYKTEDDEKFVYKLNDAGTTMNVYNENNSLINSMKVLSRG